MALTLANSIAAVGAGLGAVLAIVEASSYFGADDHIDCAADCRRNIGLRNARNHRNAVRHWRVNFVATLFIWIAGLARTRLWTSRSMRSFAAIFGLRPL